MSLANEFVGSGGEGLEETTNTFGGFQTPFSISTKDFCAASVQGMCILSHCFSIFSMDYLKDFLHFFLHISFYYFFAYFLPISLLFVFTIFAIDFHAPKNEKQSQCKWRF